MSVKDRISDHRYPPEVVLAEMLGKEFGNGTSPDPAELRAWMIRHWGVISALAHAIHHGHQAGDPIYAERWLEQTGHGPR
jgi:hypothetical protein